MNDRPKTSRTRLVVAILVALLVVGGLVAYTIAGAGKGTTSVSSNGSSSTAASDEWTFFNSTTSPDGLQLAVALNTTSFPAGQGLGVNVSVSNTRLTNNTLSGQEGVWAFYGVPVNTWPECGGAAPYDWPYPVEVILLSGNYSARQLQAVANASFSVPCGAYSPSIPAYTFHPNSDIVNVTAVFDGGVGVRPIGTFQLASSFTMHGSWSLASLSSRSIPICIPALPRHCSPPASVPFAPGAYSGSL